MTRLATAAIIVVSLAGASCSDITTTNAASDDVATTSEESTTSSTIEATTTAPPTTTALTTIPSTTAEPTTTSLLVADMVVPSSAGELAVALGEAEAAIRNPDIDDDLARQWGERQQRLYRILASNSDWASEVLEQVPDQASFAVTKNWEARKDLTKLVQSAPLATTLPAWHLREPLPTSELLEYYREAEAQTGIGWNYLAAINLVETRMGRIEGLSTAGATGPMQFLPSTWAECCEGDPTLDRDAIIGAGVYLALVGGRDDIKKALYRYNNSDRYVASVSHYAEVMADNELALRGYHAWQVYFLSASGLLLLPSGYHEPEPVAVSDWLVDNPGALIES